MFFALELILRDFEADSFGVVVLSSFAADIVGRAAFGSHPFLALPGFELRSPIEYPLYAGLGTRWRHSSGSRSSVSFMGARISPTGSGVVPSGCGRRRVVCCSG